MKVFATSMREVPPPGGSSLLIGLGYYDESEHYFLLGELYEVTAELAADTTALVADVNAHAIAMVTMQGWGTITDSDIIWYGPSLLGQFDRLGLNGVWSPTIDGTTVGNTTVFTNNSAQDYMLTDAFIQLEAVSGLGTQPIINIGRISSSFNDIVNSLNLNILSTADTYSKVNPKNGAVLVPPGQSVVVRVATAAILTTTFNFRVMVRGVYLS